MQEAFDFDRAEQRGLVEQSQLPRTPGVSAITAKAVLRSIDDFGRGREAWPSIETLAARVNCTDRQVKRAIAALVSLSLLVVEKRVSRAGVVCNHYRIVWSELALLVPGRVPERGDMVSERGDMLSERGDILSKRGDTVSPKLKEPVELKEPSRRSEAEVLERGLRAGVYSAATIRAAIDRAGAEYVDELLDYFDAHRDQYGPGALCLRLSRCRPGQALADGWPPTQEPVEEQSPPRRDPEQDWLSIQYRIVREGKAAGAPREVIDARVEAARQRWEKLEKGGVR